jgi:hypothetical protein
MADQLIVFLVAVVAFAVVGVGIGMLVAPRLGRLAADDDEEPGDDDRPDA